jgi:hypothetical protein
MFELVVGFVMWAIWMVGIVALGYVGVRTCLTAQAKRKKFVAAVEKKLVLAEKLINRYDVQKKEHELYPMADWTESHVDCEDCRGVKDRWTMKTKDQVRKQIGGI